MRRAALRHPKTLALAALLGVPRTHAVGLLECLFDWAADMAPQGNIGKWPNIVIAGAVEWSGDADAFVAVLTEAGYLRADAEHRLLINDWHEHCENWIRSKLKAANLPFLTLKDGVNQPLKEGGLGGQDPAHPLPSLSLPSLPLSNGADAPDFACFWSLYPKRVGKGAAERAWAKAKENHAAIIADLESRKWPADLTFVPHPSTYLNAKRWLDENPDVPRVMTPADQAKADATRKLVEESQALAKAERDRKLGLNA